jgi:hypothetical protein
MTTGEDGEVLAFVERSICLHEKLADCHPSLRRGQVWCRSCGSTQKVDSADCFRHGWPKCCGYTMTIDDPAQEVTHD